MKRDIFGTTHPYCRLSLFRDLRQSSILGNSVRTGTIKRSLNPEWNEVFFFRVNPESNRLLFEIFDENRITRDNFLGYVSISLPLADIPVESPDTSLRDIAKAHHLKQRRFAIFDKFLPKFSVLMCFMCFFSVLRIGLRANWW